MARQAASKSNAVRSPRASISAICETVNTCSASTWSRNCSSTIAIRAPESRIRKAIWSGAEEL